MNPSTSAGLLRARDGRKARVTEGELFFDLIYAFAITQLSHLLLHHPGPEGALQTLILWFAVWLGWQYTCWVTNWFDPDAMPVRLLLFAVMALGLLMAASLPEAFGARGLLFALSYVCIQVGRTVAVLLMLGRGHPLFANFRRMGCWLAISGVLWIAGGIAADELRLLLWLLAVACEYASPMAGFAMPGLGRSSFADWRSADGGHIAERCQLFVILALGESVLVTGGTLGSASQWDIPVVIAVLVCFLGSVAMWWVYFDTSAEAASHALEHAREPGQMAAYLHYVHVLLIAGIIVSAAADDLVIAEPDHHIGMASGTLLLGGPAVYLIGNALYKRVIYGNIPLSHLVGLGLLALLVPVAPLTDLLMVGGLTSAVMCVVAAWESVSRRRGRRAGVAGKTAA